MLRRALLLFALAATSSCGSSASPGPDAGPDAASDATYDASDAAPYDREAADADFLACDGPSMTANDVLTRLGGGNRTDLGAFAVRHRVRTCKQGPCDAWMDATSPVPELGIVQGGGYPKHQVSPTWIAAMTMVNGGPVFSFGLTVTPDPLGVPSTEWGTIECRLSPQSGWCDLTGSIDGLWLGTHLWPRTRVGTTQQAPFWRLPEEANGDSFKATATCVRLRLVTKLGDEEHALVFAGSF